MLILGPSLPPRPSSSWNPLHCCALKLYTTQCKTHGPEVQQHIAVKRKRAPREGAYYRLLRTLEGDGHSSSLRLFQVAFPPWPSQAAPTERQRENFAFSLFYFFGQDTSTHTCLPSPVLDRATLWHQDGACTVPWMGHLRLLMPRQNVHCLVLRRCPQPTRTTHVISC